MSRGIGALQRKILDALIQRRDGDSYDTAKILNLVGRDRETTVVRARWRWYTLDLLDLVSFGDPRSERVGFHRAVHSLQQRGRLQIETACPYDQPFGAFENEYGGYEGGFDLSELSGIDARWSNGQGRCLWFRLPVTAAAERYLPKDDQMIILKELADAGAYGSEAFVEFTETLDRRDAWNSEVGRFIRWLFCGPLP